MNENATFRSRRLLSIDALRGFDMLLIAGGGAFIERSHGLTGMRWIDWLATQLTHPAWNGFTFYDFIFPLFLFIAGVSLSFSLQSGLERGMSKAALYKKAFNRFLILFILGLIDKNTPLDLFHPANIRYGTVLGRIGITTLVAAILYLNFGGRARLAWVSGILLAYYAAVFLIPVPGYGAGDLSFEGNLVGWIDRTFMPGILKQETYDENALLTTFPAICLPLLGTLAGDILRNTERPEKTKIGYLCALGAILVPLGLIWGLSFPINKHMWSSSFILLTGGMAFFMLALFYGIIDVLGYRRWCFFFEVIGTNSIVVYMAYRLIDFNYTSKLLFEGLYMNFHEKWHPVFNALGALALVWLLLYFLYRKRIFIKV
jgi:Uncharacterized conserved protein